MQKRNEQAEYRTGLGLESVAVLPRGKIFSNKIDLIDSVTLYS